MSWLPHRQVLAGLGIMAALAVVDACNSGPALPRGDIASALALPTLEADGAVFDATTLRGKRVLLAFWRPSCPHCLKELPELEAAVAGQSDVVAVAVMVSGEREGGLQVARSHGFTGPVLIDDTGELKRRLGIDKVPWTFVLRADGTAATSFIGENPSGTLVLALAVAR